MLRELKSNVDCDVENIVAMTTDDVVGKDEFQEIHFFMNHISRGFIVHRIERL